MAKVAKLTSRVELLRPCSLIILPCLSQRRQDACDRNRRQKFNETDPTRQSHYPSPSHVCFPAAPRGCDFWAHKPESRGRSQSPFASRCLSWCLEHGAIGLIWHLAPWPQPQPGHSNRRIAMPVPKNSFARAVSRGISQPT